MKIGKSKVGHGWRREYMSGEESVVVCSECSGWAVGGCDGLDMLKDASRRVVSHRPYAAFELFIADVHQSG